MKKSYETPMTDVLSVTTDCEVMISISQTEQDGSNALINGRRQGSGSDWDNLWQ